MYGVYTGYHPEYPVLLSPGQTKYILATLAASPDSQSDFTQRRVFNNYAQSLEFIGQTDAAFSHRWMEQDAFLDLSSIENARLRPDIPEGMPLRFREQTLRGLLGRRHSTLDNHFMHGTIITAFFYTWANRFVERKVFVDLPEGGDIELYSGAERRWGIGITFRNDAANMTRPFKPQQAAGNPHQSFKDIKLEQMH